MKKGLKVRFNDIKAMSDLNPQILEFHFSDKDLEVSFGSMKYDQELVVHMPEYWNGVLIDPASDGQHIKRLSREDSVKVIQMTLDKANEMSRHFQGRPMMVLHPGGMSLKPARREAIPSLLDALEQSVKELRPGDVEILLENMPPFPWFYGGQWICNIQHDAQETLDFCTRAGLNVCFDISHAQLYCTKEGKDLDEYITILKPLIKHIHVADAYGVDGEGIQIDEGEIDFAKVMRHFGDFERGVIPEIWYGHRDGGKGFMTAFERLEKYF